MNALTDPGTREYDRLRAVIFDFDGVILESAEIKTKAFLDLFADYTQHREAILRHHLDNVGISRFRKFEWIYSQLLGKELAADERRRLGDEFTNIVLKKILDCDFVPGAVDCLESLKGRMTLFVASGTPQEELEFIIEKRGLTPYFAEIWGSPATKVEIIRSILERFGFNEYEVLLIGDGLSDLEAATEARIPFLARKNAAGEVNWRSLGTRVVSDLVEVPPFLGIHVNRVRNVV